MNRKLKKRGRHCSVNNRKFNNTLSAVEIFKKLIFFIFGVKLFS